MYRIRGFGRRRQFEVTCGLVARCGESTEVHSVEQAIKVVQDWMKSRAAACHPFLTGMVSPGQEVYAWPKGPGAAGAASEPIIRFSGEVSILYNSELTDEEVGQLLDEVAGRLGATLGQTQVYVAYRDQAWVLQDERSFAPTGEVA